ncbi:MAG: hypothetical protein QF605_08825, partial [Rhodospirillales bacterium]|nr:hypothetical protein [Rhodospirillales bacterium]
NLMINIQQFDHAGVRITDRDRALKFYAALGFKIHLEVDFDAVIVIKNANDVEINLVVNGVDLNDGKKHPDGCARETYRHHPYCASCRVDP